MEGDSIDLARVERTKNCLASYKELLAINWEVLTWKREWYSLVLVAAVTLLYSLVWWNDITVLTAFSLMGLFLFGIDIAAMHGRGVLTSMIAWNADREREFADMCVWISQAQSKISGFKDRVGRYRETSPIVYYVTASTILLILAWIGSSVPNMLLCYWATVALVLTPGITRNGLVAKYATQVYVEVNKLLRRYLPVKKAAADASKQE